MLKLFISFWSARTHAHTHTRTQGLNTCLLIAQYFIACAHWFLSSSRRLLNKSLATQRTANGHVTQLLQAIHRAGSNWNTNKIGTVKGQQVITTN
jgi:hypothetical protein